MKKKNLRHKQFDNDMQSRLDYLDSMMNTLEVHSRDNTTRNKDKKKLYPIYDHMNNLDVKQYDYSNNNHPFIKEPKSALPNMNYQRINSNKLLIKPSSIDNDSTEKDDQNASVKKTVEVNIDLNSNAEPQSPAKQKLSILNKNSTASYLLNKAKIRKMQRNFPRKPPQCPMPEMPETSKKHRASIPKLPILTHRTSSASGLIKSNIELSKEGAQLKEIFSRRPSETKLDYLKITKNIKPSSSTSRIYYSSTARTLASTEKPKPVKIKRHNPKKMQAKVKAKIREQYRRYAHTCIPSER